MTSVRRRRGYGKSILQKHRLWAIRIFSLLLLPVLLFSESAWTGKAGGVANLLFIAGLILVGIATTGRLWTYLYNTGYRDASLVTTGPYSLCRNPLYVCSFVGSVGLGLTTKTLLLPAIIALGLMLFYKHIVAGEEKKLTALFGIDYMAYRAGTNRFIPDFRRLREPDEYRIQVRRIREKMIRNTTFLWVLAAILLIQAMQDLAVLPTYFVIR